MFSRRANFAQVREARIYYCIIKDAESRCKEKTAKNADFYWVLCISRYRACPAMLATERP
jgi:hypothetical protein